MMLKYFLKLEGNGRWFCWVVILPCITDFPKSKIGNIHFWGLVKVSGSVRFDLSLIKITHFLHFISKFFCGNIDNIALIHSLRPPFGKFCTAASVVQRRSSQRWRTSSTGARMPLTGLNVYCSLESITEWQHFSM